MTTVRSIIPGTAPFRGGEQCDLLTPHKQNNGVNIPTKLVVKDHDAQTLPTSDETNTAGGDTSEGGNTTLPAEIEGGPNTYSNHRDDAFITESNLDMVVQNMKQYVEHLEEEKCEMHLLLSRKEADLEALAKKLKKQKRIRKKLKKLLFKKKKVGEQPAAGQAQPQALSLGPTNVRRWTLNIPNFRRPQQGDLEESSCDSIGFSDGFLDGISTDHENSMSSMPIVIEQEAPEEETPQVQQQEEDGSLLTDALRADAEQLIRTVAGKHHSGFEIPTSDHRLKEDIVRLLRVINGEGEHAKLSSRNILLALRNHAIMKHELEELQRDNAALNLMSALAFEDEGEEASAFQAKSLASGNFDEVGVKIGAWKSAMDALEKSRQNLVLICQKAHGKIIEDVGRMEDEDEIIKTLIAKNELYKIFVNSSDNGKAKIQELESELQKYREGGAVVAWA